MEGRGRQSGHSEGLSLEEDFGSALVLNSEEGGVSLRTVPSLEGVVLQSLSADAGSVFVVFESPSAQELRSALKRRLPRLIQGEEPSEASEAPCQGCVLGSDDISSSLPTSSEGSLGKDRKEAAVRGIAVLRETQLTPFKLRWHGYPRVSSVCTFLSPVHLIDNLRRVKHEKGASLFPARQASHPDSELLLATSDGHLLKGPAPTDSEAQDGLPLDARGFRPLQIGNCGEAVQFLVGGGSFFVCGVQDKVAKDKSASLLFFGGTAFSAQAAAKRIDQRVAFSPRLMERLFPSCNICVLACSECHVLAVSQDGRCFAWGSNDAGQLGIGRQTGPVTWPVQVKVGVEESDRPVIHIRSVAAGEQFSLAVSEDQDGNDVWCWGFNICGQLGLGHTESVLTPQRIERCVLCSSGSEVISSSLPPVRQIAAGGLFAALLTKDGNLLVQGRMPGELPPPCVSSPSPRIRNFLLPTLLKSSDAPSSFFSAICATSRCLAAFRPLQVVSVQPALLPVSAESKLRIGVLGIPTQSLQRADGEALSAVVRVSVHAESDEEDEKTPKEKEEGGQREEKGSSNGEPKLEFLIFGSAEETLEDGVPHLSVSWPRLLPRTEVFLVNCFDSPVLQRDDYPTWSEDRPSSAQSAASDAGNGIDVEGDFEEEELGWCIVKTKKKATGEDRCSLRLSREGPETGRSKTLLKTLLSIQQLLLRRQVLSTQVQFSLDGLHWAKPAAKHLFLFRGPTAVESVSPPCASLQGSQSLLVRLAKDFRAEERLQMLSSPVVKFSCIDTCLTQSQTQASEALLSDSFTALVPAQFAPSGNSVICVLPKFDERLLLKHRLAVDVSLNGRDFTGSPAPFQLLDPTIAKAEPPIVASGAATTLRLYTQQHLLQEKHRRETGRTCNMNVECDPFLPEGEMFSLRESLCLARMPDGSELSIPLTLKEDCVEVTFPALETETPAGGVCTLAFLKTVQSSASDEEGPAREDSGVSGGAKYGRGGFSVQLRLTFNGLEFSSSFFSVFVYPKLQPCGTLAFTTTLSTGLTGLDSDSSEWDAAYTAIAAAALSDFPSLFDADTSLDPSASPPIEDADSPDAAVPSRLQVVPVDDDSLLTTAHFLAVSFEAPAATPYRPCARLAVFEDCSSAVSAAVNFLPTSVTGASDERIVGESSIDKTETTQEQNAKAFLIVPAVCEAGTSSSSAAALLRLMDSGCSSSGRNRNKRSTSREAGKAPLRGGPTTKKTSAVGGVSAGDRTKAQVPLKGKQPQPQQQQLQQQQQRSNTLSIDAQSEKVFQVLTFRVPQIPLPSGEVGFCTLEISIDGQHFFPLEEKSYATKCTPHISNGKVAALRIVKGGLTAMKATFYLDTKGGPTIARRDFPLTSDQSQSNSEGLIKLSGSGTGEFPGWCLDYTARSQAFVETDTPCSSGSLRCTLAGKVEGFG